MLNAQDCLRRAFQALLDGDTAERDRWCALAKNILEFERRVAEDLPPFDAEPIVVNREKRRA